MDVEIGEDAEGPLKFPELFGSRDPEAVALAHHHAERKRHLHLKRAHEIERGGQPVTLDLAHDLEPVGAAGMGFSRVSDRLDDDLEQQGLTLPARGQLIADLLEPHPQILHAFQFLPLRPVFDPAVATVPGIDHDFHHLEQIDIGCPCHWHPRPAASR